MGAEVLGNDGAATTRRRRGASRGFTYGRGGPWAFATRARGADWPPRVRSLPRDRLSTFAGRKRNIPGHRNRPRVAHRVPRACRSNARGRFGSRAFVRGRSPRTDEDCATLHAARTPPPHRTSRPTRAPRRPSTRALANTHHPRALSRVSRLESRLPTRALANRRRPRDYTRHRSCPPRERSRRPSPTCTPRLGCPRRPPTPRSAAPTATSSPRRVREGSIPASFRDRPERDRSPSSRGPPPPLPRPEP